MLHNYYEIVGVQRVVFSLTIDHLLGIRMMTLQLSGPQKSTTFALLAS